MNKIKRPIGLHVRIDDSLQTTFEAASKFNMDAIQFFLLQHKTNKYVKCARQEMAWYQAQRALYQKIYIHSSYWVNLAHGSPESYVIAEKMLAKEMRLAERLDASGIIIHPGSHKRHLKTDDDPEGYERGIQQIVDILNLFAKKYSSVPLILENTAHQRKTIGSDFIDFVEIKKRLKKPEQFKICLDVAHAFVFGYDLQKPKEFIAFLEKTIGLDSIALIHLHESAEPLGSGLDRHALLDEGLIGLEALKELVMNERLKDSPLILELPVVSDVKAHKMLDLVRSWHV